MSNCLISIVSWRNTRRPASYCWCLFLTMGRSKPSDCLNDSLTATIKTAGDVAELMPVPHKRILVREYWPLTTKDYYDKVQQYWDCICSTTSVCDRGLHNNTWCNKAVLLKLQWALWLIDFLQLERSTRGSNTSDLFQHEGSLIGAEDIWKNKQLCKGLWRSRVKSTKTKNKRFPTVIEVPEQKLPWLGSIIVKSNVPLSQRAKYQNKKLDLSQLKSTNHSVLTILLLRERSPWGCGSIRLPGEELSRGELQLVFILFVSCDFVLHPSVLRSASEREIRSCCTPR